MLIANVSVLSAQNVQVKGRVADEFGEGLPGATIMIKGTANGTISDLDGNYTIQAEVNNILQVSFVGYDSYELIVTKNGKAIPMNKQLKAALEYYKSDKQKFIHPVSTSKVVFEEDTTLYATHNPEQGVAVLNKNNT